MWYELGDDHSAKIPQKVKTLLDYWRFARHGTSWQEETMRINAGTSMESKARAQSWKNEWARQWAVFRTGIAEFWDETFWFKPEKNLMEGVDGRRAKSIPVFLNEGTNGLFNQGSAAGGSWTTIHGVDVASVPKYDHYRATYGASGNTGFATAHPENIIYALDDACEATKLKAPPIYKGEFQPDQEFLSGGFLCTSKIGRNLTRMTYRHSNCRWDNENDPYGNPLYGGLPLVRVGRLSDAPLYLNAAGTNTVSEMDANAEKIGPRIYGIDPNYLQMRYFGDQFLEPQGPINDRTQPKRWTYYLFSIANMMCTDRRRMFLISPAASQTGILTIYDTDSLDADFPSS